MSIMDGIKTYVDNAKLSIMEPAKAAKQFSGKASLGEGAKVLALYTVLTTLVVFVLAFITALISMVSQTIIGFATADLMGAVVNAIMAVGFGLLPVMAMIPALLVIVPFVIVVTIINNGILWIIGKLLGGKASFDKFYGTIVYLNAAVALASSVVTQLWAIVVSLLGLLITLVVIIVPDIGIVTAILTGIVATGVNALIGLVFALIMLHRSVVFVKELHQLSDGRAWATVLIPFLLVAVPLTALAVIAVVLFGAVLFA